MQKLQCLRMKELEYDFTYTWEKAIVGNEFVNSRR